MTKALTTITLLLLAATANAASVTVFGTDVKFTYDDATIYGGANVVGNTIYFLPTSFTAESLDGTGPDITSAPIDITIEVTSAGLAIDTLLYLENGDYRLSGIGASGDVTGDLTIDSLTSAYSDSSAFGTGALAATGGTLTAWSASTSLNLADTTGWDMDTKILASITNTLTTDTVSINEVAFIEKKFAGGAPGLTVDLTPVPVPAAAWLFGTALGLLGWMRRKTS